MYLIPAADQPPPSDKECALKCLKEKGEKAIEIPPSAIAGKENWIAYQPKLMSLEFNLIASSDFGSQLLRVWRGSVTLDLIQGKVGISSISRKSKHFSRGENLVNF